jgi:site-specific DNA recombinase
MARATQTSPRRRRCAIYTRKSSEEGLEQEFNSLDAQREACEAYVSSQRSEGWKGSPARYDDGGFSGGTLDRPGLTMLLEDVKDGLVDVIVVYKIDRLSRSLMDFAKLVEIFDAHEVTFVSVTQSFNTTTSMGRLTLNILLSFAQFEREVTAERIRDKFAASRKKGMWMGGNVPLGYDVRDRKLVINEPEAKTVRHIFTRFVDLGSATVLTRELRKGGILNKQARPIDKGFLYRLLNNRVYIGEAVHKGTSYPGEHKAIIDRDLWDRVHAVLQVSPRSRAANTRAQTPALLKGLIFTDTGTAMTPTHTRKASKLYRYYVSMDCLKGRETGFETAPRRLPAGMVEAAVVGEIRKLIRAPEIVARTAAGLAKTNADLTEADVMDALASFDSLWDTLFPTEQARLVQLLVKRVTISATGIAVDLRVGGKTGGLNGVILDILSSRKPRDEAAA